MGLSNYVPNSRISQAGVVDNTADRPATPYEGQLVYQRDTNQLLVWDGSAWVMIADTDQPPGLQRLTSGTFTNATNFEITGFSSDYTSYRAVFRVSRHSGSGANELQAQLFNGATAKTGYYGSGWFAGYLGTSGNVGNRNNAANFPLTSAGSSSVANFVVLDITGMTNDEFTCTGSGFDQGNVRHETFGYARFTVDTNDRIRVVGASANITGSWRLYGYRD